MHETANEIALELTALRMSVALLAQRLGIESPLLPVLGKDQAALAEMAVDFDRGWNGLVQLCYKRISELQERHNKCLAN